MQPNWDTNKTEVYNQTFLERLEEKVGYELWYLKYIAKTQDIFEGGEKLTTIEFNSENNEVMSVYFIAIDGYTSLSDTDLLKANLKGNTNGSNFKRTI